MERPGVRVHLWILLLIQATLWVSSVSGLGLGEACSTGQCDSDLVCDTVNSTCKLDTGTDCSGSNSTQCKSGTTCEADVCRINLGGNCSTSPQDLCVANAVCDSGTCKLDTGKDCSGSNSTQCKLGTTCEGDVCRINLGGRCSTSPQDLCVANAVCDSGTCKLDTGKDCSGSNSTQCKSGTTCEADVCRINLGGSCSTSPQDLCVANAVCDSGTCKLDTGKDCSGSNSTQCKSGTTCEADVCRINLGGSCSTSPQDLCVANAVCDSGTCKLDTGKDCSGSNSTQCKSGTTCEADVCRINLGGSCSTSPQDLCVANAVCDSGTCKLDTGKDCSGSNSTQCKSGTTCEADVCRINLGGSCSTSPQDLCVANAVCDSGTCKLDTGKDCSGSNSTQCKSGTTCEADVCRINLGGSCSTSPQDLCVANAVCDSGTCKLDTGKDCSGSNSTQCKSGTTCEGDVCRINLGGSCSTSPQDLCVANAVCDSGTCKLDTGKDCSGSNSTQCKSGTTCEGDVCRINLGGSCSTSPQDLCVANAVCDSGTCKLDAGKDCSGTNSNLCKSGTKCEGDVCRIKKGGSCSASPDYCELIAVCDSSICKLKPGQTCTSGECKSNTDCENSKCKIQVGFNCSGYSNDCVSIAECYQSACKVTYGNVCSGATCTASLSCRAPASGNGGNSLCLCGDGHYRYGGVCESVNNLLVTNVGRNGDPMETVLSVQWSAPSKANAANALSYRAVVSIDTTREKTTSTTNVSFSGTSPGTSYVVSVYTSALRDPDHDTKTTTETTNSASASIYTKPARPGDLSADIYQGPNVTIRFKRSNGTVDTYDVKITQRNNSGFTMQKDVSGTGQGDVVVTFYGLTPYKIYDVEIQAQSGGLYGDIRQANFRVSAELAGEVSQLTVKTPESRSVNVSWRYPAQPNGKIQGYGVEVKQIKPKAEGSLECVLRLEIRCPNCSLNESMRACAVNKTILKTLAELADDTVVLEAMLDGLKPDVMYQITVAAFNQVGRGTVKSDTATTDQEAAKDLQSLTSTPSDVGQLTVTWQAGERTGPTNYTVTWEEQNSLGSPDYTVRGSVNVTGYRNNTHTISGLLSYWQYRVTVQPHTVKGSSPSATSNTTRTKESAPGEVKTFNISQPPDTAVRLDLVVVCPEERQRNGPIAKFTYTSTVDGDTQVPLPSGEIQVNGDVCEGNKAVTVEAENTYNFTLRAVTSGGIEGNVTTTTKIVDPRPPKLQKSDKGTELLAAGQTTETSVTVDVCPCVVDPDQGHIVKAGCTVCVKSDKELCEPASGNTVKDSYDRIQTWKKFKNSSYTGRYRPTPDNWHEIIASGKSRGRRSVLRRVARAVENGVQYTIGANTTCDEYPDDVFCNGQLTEGTNFVIIVWACTEGGCSESPDVISVQTKSPDVPPSTPPIGAIVGGIVAALAVIAIVVVVVIVYRRRRSRKEEDPDGSMNPTTVSLKPVRKPIRLRDFATHLDRLHRDSNLLFQEEFETKPNSVSPHIHQEFQDVLENSPKHYTQEASTMDANKVKNRYVNILPYDHTRVKLSTDDDDETSDFINANYIPGYTSPREYIATQGPMTGTVADFWRMMWEQKSTLIVMLSDLSEKGRPKVDLYWPTELNSPVQYGDIVVELTSDSTLNKYTIRTFNICLENQPEDRRRVVQYFIPGWEDYSANLNPDDVLDFISTVRQEARSSQGPVTVHCSAGVGRTGTFIALDFLMQFVNDHSLDDEVDIYNLVLNMRHNRPHMVQSEKQYVFIHDTLKLIIEKKIKEMQAHNDENIYQNTGGPEENVYANEAFQPEENLYENTSFKPTTSL